MSPAHVTREADSAGLVEEIGRLVDAAPSPLPWLDQVTATAESVVRRALWLDSTFDLTGRRLLLVGDHDLTSLAVGAVNPDVTVTVVDLDERLLEFIDDEASRRGMNIRCLFAELRFGLPPAAVECGDVVFTDPPYTPEGAQLFCARGLQGLGDRDDGRLLVAYGFSDRHLTLGLKVQRAIQRLHVVFEAILPNFNHYHGAEAVGSASDLYVCRPTARTWQAGDRLVEETTATIYTHGPQALEGAPLEIEAEVAEAVEQVASGRGGSPVSIVVGDAWPSAGAHGASKLGSRRLIAEGVPPAVGRQVPLVAVVDLSADPGFWLLRVLLAANVDRMAVLVPNNHPDLANEAGQRRFVSLTRHKYAVRLHRSIPRSRDAVVEAERVDPTALGSGERVARRLLDRAHGKVVNVWREALIQLSRERGGISLTKNRARAVVRECTTYPCALDARLIDVPRHQIAALMDDVTSSARRVRERATG